MILEIAVTIIVCIRRISTYIAEERNIVKQEHIKSSTTMKIVSIRERRIKKN